MLLFSKRGSKYVILIVYIETRQREMKISILGRCTQTILHFGWKAYQTVIRYYLLANYGPNRSARWTRRSVDTGGEGGTMEKRHPHSSAAASS